MDHHRILILGAGVSGLVAGYEFVRRGIPVTILESENEPGGLFRTVSRDGYRFDLGGHRLYSEKPEIMDYYRDLGGNAIHEVERRSSIRLRERLIDYPLELSNAITAFGPVNAVRIGSSYLKAALASSRNGHGNGPSGEFTFEDWVVSRFGRALYEIYFRPYTEKVWGIPCTEISSHWASSRITVGNLFQAIYKSVFKRNTPKTLIDRFLYPDEGVGTLCDELVRRIEASGIGVIRTGSPVAHLSHDGKVWRATAGDKQNHERFEGDQVISTIPIHALVDCLETGGMGTKQSVGAATRELFYRDLVIVFMPINKRQVSPDSWTYFPDTEVIFGRTHEPRNWSVRMTPDGSTSLCLEIFAGRGDELWKLPDSVIIDRCADALARFGMLSRDEIVGPWVMRLTDAYPIYNIGYKPHLTRLHDYAASLPGFHLLGRTGSFKYMNSDLVIELAVAMVNKITVGIHIPT